MGSKTRTPWIVAWLGKTVKEEKQSMFSVVKKWASQPLWSLDFREGASQCYQESLFLLKGLVLIAFDKAFLCQKNDLLRVNATRCCESICVSRKVRLAHRGVSESFRIVSGLTRLGLIVNRFRANQIGRIVRQIV